MRHQTKVLIGIPLVLVFAAVALGASGIASAASGTLDDGRQTSWELDLVPFGEDGSSIHRSHDGRGSHEGRDKSFWRGQFFELWPFFVLVATFIVFATLAFGHDFISQRRWKLPSGAAPRVELAIDPTAIARSRFHTSLFLIRLGSSIAAVASVPFLYIAFNPLAIGDQVGYTQYSDNAVIAGAAVSLVAAFIALAAAVVVHKSPPALLSLILVASILVVLGPFITTTERLYLGIMVVAMAIPEGMVMLGVALGFRHYGRTKRTASNSTPTSPPFSASVP